MSAAYEIREFKSGRVVENAVSYEAGFDRCIELRANTGDSVSYYVARVVSA